MSKMGRYVLEKQMEEEAKRHVDICSICFEEYRGYGNNAQPINDGQCCDECNNIVMISRLNKLKLNKHEVDK